MNDLKFAVHQLLKNSDFTAVTVLTPALDIGGNTPITGLILISVFLSGKAIGEFCREPTA